MNPFMALGGIISLAAGLWALYHHDYLMFTGYTAWAVADFAFGLKG